MLILSAACGDPAMFKAEYDKLRSVQVGWTEEQVKAHLGEPWKVYTKDGAPEDYYVEGWAHKERPITNKVWIYIEDEPSAYVYFDAQNRVEEIFVGGS